MKNSFRNKFLNNFRKSRRALSPAIAIALLLAITIALVAAVGYAANMVTPKISTGNTQGTFSVEIDSASSTSVTGGGVTIKEISGDSIPTSDLELKFIADGVETDVTPNVNNTFYLDWPLFNPTTAYDIINYVPWAPTYTSAPGSDELTNTAQTGVGIQICDSTYNASDTYLAVGDHYWLESGITVYLSSDNGATWVPTTQGADQNYTEAWHGVTSTYAMYYANNPNDVTFTLVRVTNPSGVTFIFNNTEEQLENDGESPALNGGHAVYLRISEYNSPFLWEPSAVPTGDMSLSFGNFAITPGDTLESVGNGFNNFGGAGNTAVISNFDQLKSGDTVQVYIIDTANSQVIWQGDVTVQ